MKKSIIITILLMSMFWVSKINLQSVENVDNIKLSTFTIHPDKIIFYEPILDLLKIRGYGTLKNTRFFPKLVETTFTIEMPEYNNYEVVFFDANHKLLFTRIVEDEMQTSFDFVNLEKGTYLVYVVDREHKLVAKGRFAKL